MKIELRENKRHKFDMLRRKFILEKSNQENILFIGTTGSGKTECLLSFIYNLYNQKKIDKYIYIDIKGDLSLFVKHSSILDKFKKTFNLFNLLKQNNLDFFEKIDFKNITIKKELNKKSLLFLFPALQKSFLQLNQLVNKKIAQFLINLPKNNNKEIPIFIDGIELLKESDFKKFERIVKIINKKGYFVVCSISDYSFKKPEDLIMALEKCFQHVFLMKSELHREEYLENYFSGYKERVHNLNAGEYYYLKDFKKVDYKKRKMPYELNKIDLGAKNNYTEITEEYIEKKLKTIDKIKKF